jgi:hypothetical protein
MATVAVQEWRKLENPTFQFAKENDIISVLTGVYSSDESKKCLQSISLLIRLEEFAGRTRCIGEDNLGTDCRSPFGRISASYLGGTGLKPRSGHWIF